MLKQKYLYNEELYSKKTSFLPYIISLFIFIIPFWGLHYTSDWAGYNYVFNNPSESRDYFFELLSTHFKNYGYAFEDLYRFHILLMGMLFQIIFYKLRCKPIIITICMIIFMYVSLGNQIRFYCAMPLSILSFWYLKKQRYLISFLFIVLATLFHASSILFFSAFIIFNFFFSKKKVYQQIIYLLIANIIISLSLGLTQLFDVKYLYYLEKVSSFRGGLFNSIPSLLAILFIIKYNTLIPEKKQSELYNILYTLCISTSIFFIAGFQIQILTNRFISSILPFWIAFFIYSYTGINSNLSIKRKARKYIIAIILFMSIWKFLVCVQLGVDSSLLEAGLMIESYQL